MLQEVDNLTSDRHRAEPRLRTVSVWVGEFPDERALTRYLSPDEPSAGAFARDIGEEWYDSDALEATHLGALRPVTDIISPMAAEIGLPRLATTGMLRAMEDRGVHTANAIILLHRHTFDDVGSAGPGLVFAGTVEYLQGAPDESVEQAVETALARPVVPMRTWQLFIGVTTARSSMELEQYARDGGFVADMGGEEGLAVSSFDPVGGIVAISHGLETGEASLSAAEFFALPAVTDRLVFESSDDPVRTAARREIAQVNALIAFYVGPMRRAPGSGLFCGLRNIGAHRAAASSRT